jgi:phage terminase small subunit
MNAFEPASFVIVREGSAPDAPPTLDERGATLWREVLTSRRITSAAELTILEHACQCHSRAETLRQEIETHGELIVTETGAVKANPLLMVEVSCRALCSRLLGKLRSPEDKPRMGRPPGQKPSF